MHVAIVGAGALGIVYGTLLAKVGVAVTFVVRPARVADEQPFILERVDGDQARHTFATPPRASAVPPDADVVLVCVRAEQIDDALVALLAPSSAPAVFLTPMFPKDLAVAQAGLGDRVIPAMPSVVAYFATTGAVRFWLPGVAVTQIEETKPRRVEIEALVKSLVEAGISSRIEMGVHETNMATTVTFIPVTMGIDAAGGIDRLMENGELLDIVLRAVDEGIVLGRTVGKAAGWSDIFMKFLSPFTLRVGIGLAKRRSPEAVLYVEEHFGRKLHVQNVR
ncbi:MAG: oxidoreductase, partial [Myxococcaceae bacterium]|nr:oxidoreductase [Myxococcaceae bacterium]